MKQRELIHNTNWDIIIFLDAVRFDYFERYYDDIFGDKGKLTKVISPATFTYGWMVETFEGTEPMKDVIFVSSDYEVANSKGIKPGGRTKNNIRDFTKRLKYNHSDLDTKDYFGKIVDLWEYGYDENLGAIPPETVTNVGIEMLKKYPNKRYIIYYWQIHDPYLYFLKKGETHKEITSRVNAVYKWTNLKNLINKFISDETFWTIKEKFGIESKGLAETWLKYGRSGIIKGYAEDLIYTLKNVKKMIDMFPNKKFVITTDHGELLGEYGKYGHAPSKRYKELIEVPWYEVN